MVMQAASGPACATSKYSDAYEGHDVAVTLERVVESEGPNLEPYRLLQASRARESKQGARRRLRAVAR
jgi:hypothetical protein